MPKKKNESVLPETLRESLLFRMRKSDLTGLHLSRELKSRGVTSSSQPMISGILRGDYACSKEKLFSIVEIIRKYEKAKKIISRT